MQCMSCDVRYYRHSKALAHYFDPEIHEYSDFPLKLFSGPIEAWNR